MTLPFQKIKIVLPGDPDKKDEPLKEVMARIQPADIEAYHDCEHWGSLIIFKSGQAMMTQYSADEIEGMLDYYWRKVAENMKRMQAGPTILPIS